MHKAWTQIYSRKECVDCNDNLKVGYKHLLSREHLITAQNVQYATFEKCHYKDMNGNSCKNMNTCKHCRDAIAKGWIQYVSSAIVAFIFCVRNCETWEELQEKQRAAIH